MRGRQQKADAGARAEFADVERDHLRQRAVEQGGELIGEKERGITARSRANARRKRYRWPSDSSAGLRSSNRASDRPQAARASSRCSTGPAKASIKGTSGNSSAATSPAPELPAGGAEQRRFAGAGRPGEQDQVAGPDVEDHLLGDGVRRLLVGEAEQVGDLPGWPGCESWDERGSEW